jgi:hypothetical protein
MTRRRQPQDIPAHIRELHAVAQAMHADDPEFFESGCGDVTAKLVAHARRVGISAEQRFGYGFSRKGQKRGVPHAWMSVDGKLYDPVDAVHHDEMGKHLFSSYREDPSVAILVRTSEPEDY